MSGTIHWVKCGKCDGIGTVIYGNVGGEYHWKKCDRCNGTGLTETMNNPCAPEDAIPKRGDIVAWRGSSGQLVVGICGEEITQGDAVLVMRRAEVEARVKEGR